MPNDRKDENPYIEGVSVKIIEKYKRPPAIRLPNSCQNCTPRPVIYEEYDFSLERNVLTQIQEWRKSREERAEKRRERIERLKEVENEAEKKLDTLNSEDSCAEVSKPLETNVLTPTNVVTSAQSIPRRNQTAFNYSDFETDTSSPFDNVELKTINEMEVLASVLSLTNEPRGSKPPSLPSNNNNNIPTKNGVVWNGLMYSSPQYYEPAPQLTNAYPNIMYAAEPSTSQASWMTGYSTPFVAAHPAAFRYHSVDTAQVRADTGLDDSRLRSNSKSVPDLVVALENELKEKHKLEEMRRKTKTPPPRPTLSKGLEDWKPWPVFESSRPADTELLNSLPSSMKSLASDIREMGFPLDRIIRTIKKFNGDDKKVIEFLLQVQRFEERKFRGDLVEKALHANKYDEKETLKHLEAAAVLLDLGFDHEKVQRVLLESQNDRDAALERLIS